MKTIKRLHTTLPISRKDAHAKNFKGMAQALSANRLQTASIKTRFITIAADPFEYYLSTQNRKKDEQ